MKRGQLAILGLVMAVASVNCGSSSGSSVDASAAIASCNAYCTAYIAANCPQPNYASVDECKTQECTPLSKAPAGCQMPLKTYYDCQASQADLCPTACDTEFNAVQTCH